MKRGIYIGGIIVASVEYRIYTIEYNWDMQILFYILTML